MIASEAELNAVTPPERDALVVLYQRMCERDDVVVSVSSGGETTTLPASAVEAVRAVIAALAEDGGVSVTPIDHTIRTQTAANLLNVSRPYLTKLLDNGDIPSFKVGNQRRVRVDDVLAYKKRRSEARRAAIDALIEASEEYGLYGDQ